MCQFCAKQRNYWFSFNRCDISAISASFLVMFGMVEIITPFYIAYTDDKLLKTD